jgi:hypothetical protein
MQHRANLAVIIRSCMRHQVILALMLEFCIQHQVDRGGELDPYVCSTESASGTLMKGRPAIRVNPTRFPLGKGFIQD